MTTTATDLNADALAALALVYGTPAELQVLRRQLAIYAGDRCPECEATDIEDNNCEGRDLEYRCATCDHRWAPAQAHQHTAVADRLAFAPRRRALRAVRSAVQGLAWEGWRRRGAESRGPRWIVTAGRVVELAAWDVAYRCWRTEDRELHPWRRPLPLALRRLRMAARSSCIALAGDPSPAAAPIWLTRAWTLMPGLASIALARGAARCCTEQRADGSLSHHIPWHGLDAVCIAPSASTF